MQSSGFQIQALEQRLLFASTPASPRADSLGTAFDKGERQVLLDRMSNLSSATHASLQAKLDTSVGQFDSALLGYMRARTSPNFFFDDSQADNIGSFIKNNNVSYTDAQNHADDVTNSHLFPDQSSSADYTVDLPDNINWVKPGGSTNPEFLHSLNRHAWWQDLVSASAIVGDAKYAAELEYELASWSQQFSTADTPAAWSKSDQSGWLLDTSIRAESWTWGYFGFLGNSHFTGAEDSLFLYKLMQHGDFLYANSLSTTDFGSNRAVALGKGLLYIGEMFPEFDKADKWESSARSLLFKCMDVQIYSDGSHLEQSPTYTANVADDLLEARQLDDKLNGNAWPAAYRTKLSNMIDSYWQMLSPDGTRPAIGDTYRNSSFLIFLKSELIQETTRWPAGKPRTHDVWVLGTNAVSPYVNDPVNPSSLGTRGNTYGLQESGNYIMRSGNSADANQLIFDAGPKGGVHGHFDLLNFELFGHGRPLISDPGAYKYDTSANRAYVVSTQAHNTINADGQNVSEIEGVGNPDIKVSQWKVDADSAQVTATHHGYNYLDGSPTITRSIWYDLDGTILVVDWAEGDATHAYQESFNLQTEGDANNVTVDAPNLTARTRYSSGGNVKIQGITTDETAVKGALTFVTNQASGDYKDDAYRFTLNKSGKFVVFVTLVTAYDGQTAPNTTASVVSDLSTGGTVTVQLTKNGVAQNIDFTRPLQSKLDATGTTRGTFNDIAFDSKNRLHYVYADRDTNALMYAIRDAKGNWSVPTTIDAAVSSQAGAYQYISLAVDNNGNPGVAYFNGWDGDLRYAFLDPNSHSWQVQTVESKGSTGLYPSLAFSRGNGPVISYYNRTKGDLDLAQSSGTGFSITPIDSAGDVGRFSSLLLDPNRPTVTKWAIAYEDTTNGNYKYTLQGLFAGGTQVNGYSNYTVDDLAIGGGYVSLAFYDSGTNDGKRYKPAMSYYDAGDTALRFARASDIGSSWSAQTVADKKIQGLYTQLFFDHTGKANIFYYDRSNNEAVRAVLSNNSWVFFNLRAGGREIHTSLDGSGNIAYSTLNEAVGNLNVYVI